MKLLILGGTRFLGRHLAQQAIESGHAVTLLHRGHSGPALFPQAQHLIADRNADLSALTTGTWDAAIDTNAYVPRHVATVAAALAGRVGQYQLVSSISVYAAFDVPGQDEDAAVQTLADPTAEDVNPSTYGGLKVVCEQAAQAGFAGRCLVARPGLLVGPHDPTGRFTWWVRRFQRAADAGAAHEVLAPGSPGAPAQCIDARDAAAWLLLQAERGSSGVFNLNGPAEPTTMGDVLDTARRTLAPAARLTWVAEPFLLGQGVQPWTDLPLWLPQASAGMHQLSVARALATGLQMQAAGTDGGRHRRLVARGCAALQQRPANPRRRPGAGARTSLVGRLERRRRQARRLTRARRTICAGSRLKPHPAPADSQPGGWPPFGRPGQARFGTGASLPPARSSVGACLMCASSRTALAV